MQVLKPRIFLAPDSGDGDGGDGQGAGKQQAQAKKPDQNKDGSGAGDDAAGETLPDDPAELKKLLAQEKAAHKHTIEVHTEMKGKFQRREQEDTHAREEALKKKGEFEALYNELKPKHDSLESRVAKQEASLARYLEEELKHVPDNLKALVPEGDVTEKLDWINKAKASGALKPAERKPGDGSPPPANKDVGTMSEAEWLKLKPAERAEFLNKGGKLA